MHVDDALGCAAVSERRHGSRLSLSSPTVKDKGTIGQ